MQHKCSACRRFGSPDVGNGGAYTIVRRIHHSDDDCIELASELHRTKEQVASRLNELDRDAASVAAMIEAALPVESGE